MQLFEVGGCIRDDILGIPSKDIDFTVVLSRDDLRNCFGPHRAPFDIMVAELEMQGFKIFLKTPEYLTVRARFPKGHHRNNLTADFVLARKESGYTDGRRPDRVEAGKLSDDLKRRDFTMNAIAKDSHGTLIDPHGGLRDIERRVIRAVGDPLERLSEDPLRALRAIRFSVTKGFIIERKLQFALEEPEILQGIRESVSDDRIRDELGKMFRFNTVASLLRLAEFPLLTTSIFSGNVSLDSTMKLKGRG